MNTVFDTNILVSGFEFPTGRAKQALDIVSEGHDRLFISQPIIDELVRVLTQKFGRDSFGLREVFAWIDKHCHLVTPTETLAVLADEPDNRILECALEANAAVIVTGDRAMLALQRIGNTRIVSLADYLDSVDNSLTNG